MTIYVEYAVIDNLLVNAILLWFMFRTVRNKMAFWKMTMCAGVGLFFALVLPICSMSMLTVFNPKSFYLAIGLLMAVKVFVTIMFIWLLSILIKIMTKQGKAENFIRDVTITHRDREYKIRAFLDTGNRLIDPKSLAPVVVISRDLYMKMFPILSGYYIDFATVGKRGKMLVFKPASFSIDNQSFDVRLGVSSKNFRTPIKYDALLNANIA